MYEIDITDFYNNGKHSTISGSRAELGDNAAAITWDNANRAVADFRPLDTPDKVEACMEWFKEFGAWDEEEINAWSADEVNALFLQYAAGDIREKNEMDGTGLDWEEYEALSHCGTVSGRLFKGTDGRIYFYIGS